MIVGAGSTTRSDATGPLLGFLGRWTKRAAPRTAMLGAGRDRSSRWSFRRFPERGLQGLVEYSLPVFWGFFMLTGFALFIRGEGARCAAASACRGIPSCLDFV